MVRPRWANMYAVKHGLPSVCQNSPSTMLAIKFSMFNGKLNLYNAKFRLLRPKQKTPSFWSSALAWMLYSFNLFAIECFSCNFLLENCLLKNPCISSSPTVSRNGLVNLLGVNFTYTPTHCTLFCPSFQNPLRHVQFIVSVWIYRFYVLSLDSCFQYVFATFTRPTSIYFQVVQTLYKWFTNLTRYTFQPSKPCKWYVVLNPLPDVPFILEVSDFILQCGLLGFWI